MWHILLIPAAYLLGSFPTGVVLSRHKYGIDVREMGSGNIGATNVTRVFGWYAGVLTFLVDFLKGLAPLYLLRHRFLDAPWLVTGCGVALVLGHCFSAYLRLRGGKGVATSLGVLAAVAPWAALVSGVAYVAFLLATRISALGSFAGLLASWIYLAIEKPPLPSVVMVVSVSVLVLLRHHENIRRLLSDLKKRRA